MKRCQSADRFEGPKPGPGARAGRQRYKGRFSLQQQPQQTVPIQSGPSLGGYGYQKARRKRYQLRRSPRRHRCDDYLEDLDEICTENFQCLGSTDDHSSSPPFRHSRSGSSSSNDCAAFPTLAEEKVQKQNRKKEQCHGTIDVLEILRNEMDKFRRRRRQQLLSTSDCDEEEQRHRFGDVLWLHLRAYFAGRSMATQNIRRSLGLQDRAIMKQREQRMAVIEQLMAFKFGPLVTADTAPAGIYAQIYGSSQMAALNSAIQTVDELLERWADLAELFPHSMAMQRALQARDMKLDELLRRVDTLQAWLNVTRMLLQKINEVGLFFSQIEGRHRQQSSANPGTDLPSSTASTAIQSFWPWPEPDPALPVDQQLTDLLHKILHRVVGRSLRLHGMIAVLKRLNSLTRSALERASLSLLPSRPYSQIAGQNGLGNIVKQFKERYGANEPTPSMALLSECQHFSSLHLPSFRPHFMLLLQLPIQLVTVWLEMRSEKVASTEWDLLTLDTLVEDSHDCLAESIRVKSDFLLMWNLTKSSSVDPDSAALLAKLDSHLELVFHNFLSYVRLWAHTAAKSGGSGGAEWSERIVAKMQNEWEMGRAWGVKVPRGELDAARMFCNIGRDLLELLVRRYLNEKFDCAELLVLEANECGDEEEQDFLMVDQAENIKSASSIFLLCRAFKEMIRQLRDRSLRALAFIRGLSLSLEICARYEWASAEGNCDELVALLLAGGRHVVVYFPDNADCNFLVLCTRQLANQFDQIDRLLLCATSFSPAVDEPDRKRTSPGYLLLIPTGWLLTPAEEYPEKVMMRPSLAAWNTLQHLIGPSNVYLLAADRLQLEFAQKQLDSMQIGQPGSSPAQPGSSPGRLLLVDDFCSCNDELAEDIAELKRAAFECVREVWVYSRDLGEYVLNGKRLEDLPAGEAASLKGTLLQAWSAVFECQKELSHLVSFAMHAEYFSDLLSSVQQWATFIRHSIVGQEACHAALDQLAILMGCSKKLFNAGKVPEAELLQLVAHVRTVTGHIHSLDSANAKRASVANGTLELNGTKQEGEEAVQADGHAETSAPVVQSEPALSSSFQFGEFPQQRRQMPVGERIKMGVEWLEERRHRKLLGQRRIGQVLEGEKERRNDLLKTHFFTPRREPFEWQRLENSELGSGSFGSVFLAMNLRDKFLLAVKQIQVRHDNEPSLRAMIDEVEILRTLQHPNLVKYYGVEVHKTEVLIFMEYCSEGTLARLCREGLDLTAVRRYTHFLFQAIAYIHEHGIVHRDIKTANIFLSAGEKLKLGDFGCSFRLDGTCTVPGEMLTYVGTVRYMAPEIQTNGVPLGNAGEEQRRAAAAGDGQNGIGTKGGYGRAVDIWSAGCVVLEMLTGKKPFHYLNHEFQVIYQLGMGIAPRIPADLQHNEMAHGFLRSCFVVDAALRPSARELLQHPFANILPEELDS